MNYLLLCFILGPSCFSFFLSQFFFFFVVQKRIMFMISYNVFFVYLKKFCKYGILFRKGEIPKLFSPSGSYLVLCEDQKLKTECYIHISDIYDKLPRKEYIYATPASYVRILCLYSMFQGFNFLNDYFSAFKVFLPTFSNFFHTYFVLF